MNDTLDDLPDEVRAIIEGEQEAPLAMLYAIGVEIASKRDDAKAARQTSGIEATWMECEEAYLGIDDANRHEFTDMRWAKPMALNGPVTTNDRPKGVDHRSTAFVRLTSRYVDAGAAKLGEILLPADDKAFSFDAMPVPELIAAKEDESQVVHDDVPLTRALKPGEQPPPGTKPDEHGRVPLTVKELALEKIELATKQAKAAETRIYDWMIQGGYRPEFRKMIADAARIGVGVLKGPTPKSKRVVALKKTPNGVELIIKNKIVPVVKRVDPWNFFPDPACGEDVQDGGYNFERDHMSARQVLGLKKLPGYIASQIDKVLEEGPNKSYQTSGGDRRENTQRQKDRYEVWYFTGTLTNEEMCAICSLSGKDAPDGKSDPVNVIVTLINDSVVRATGNPLDSGECNYHAMPWQRRDGHWAGVGVGEQIRTAQRVTNAALRAMLNNAGKSADNQYVIDTISIRPADGTWAITPGKVWQPTKDGAGVDMSKAFVAIQIPNTTPQMMTIIELGERMAEETTSIPLISQGQSGATTPDTFGAAQLQNNNANQLLRSIGYAADDYVTEPLVRKFYEWLLLDADVPNEEKGEFQIDAHGSAALVERAIQDQTIGQLLGASLNPAYGLNPRKAMAAYLRSKKLKASEMQYEPEEQAKIDAAPQPEAPQIAVAKINADTQLKLGVMAQQSDQQTVQHEQQIQAATNALEGVKVEAEQQATHVDATIALHELEVRRQIAALDYANKRGITLDQVKAQLAKTAMQLQTEKELNATNNAHEMRKHVTPSPPKPAVPVPGRAGNGRAASQAPSAVQ